MVAWFGRLTWSQRVGGLFGAVYVLVGIIGFIVTSGVGFAALRGKDLFVLELNPLHNILHLGIGAALLYGALTSLAASRLMDRLIGGTYLLVAILGALIVEADTSLFRGLAETRSELNILALNHPDNVLHLASAILLIGATVVGRRRSETPAPAEAVESTATGEPGDDDVEESSPLPSAAPVTRNRLQAGDVASKAGTYRCACDQFAVAIRSGREFPECPEPSGTDDDHYYELQSKASTVTNARGRTKSTARTTGSGRKSAKATSRR